MVASWATFIRGSVIMLVGIAMTVLLSWIVTGDVLGYIAAPSFIPANLIGMVNTTPIYAEETAGTTGAFYYYTGLVNFLQYIPALIGIFIFFQSIFSEESAGSQVRDRKLLRPR